MNFLSQDHLMQALARGRSVEQWLGPTIEGGERLLKWICVQREPSPDLTYSVVLNEAYDDEGPQLVMLPVLDTDQPEGEISSFASREDALEYVVNELHGSLDRFVREGEIQEEYEVYLRRRPEGRS